jgi:hypothetical protein
MPTLTEKQLRSVERTLSGGTWIVTLGAVLFSVLTVTPLVERVTPDKWDWTAPILPIVVDAAVVIVIRLDATVSRLGESGGGWPAFLRWLTGAMTLALNIGESALKGDGVGVVVHCVAPALLIFTAEAALSWRRAIHRGLDRIESEHLEQLERERRERDEREQRERDEREARERAEREERERERERREQSVRDEREHQLQQEREQRDAEREKREWEATQAREREERERRDRKEREERELRDQREREEREHREKERKEQERREEEERERREREQRRQERKARSEQPNQGVRDSVRDSVRGGVREGVRAQPSRPFANTSQNKLSEADARAAIVSGVAEGAGVRELARRTGWSLAWVSERLREVRGDGASEHPAEQEPAAELAGTGAS